MRELEDIWLDVLLFIIFVFWNYVILYFCLFWWCFWRVEINCLICWFNFWIRGSNLLRFWLIFVFEVRGWLKVFVFVLLVGEFVFNGFFIVGVRC